MSTKDLETLSSTPSHRTTTEFLTHEGYALASIGTPEPVTDLSDLIADFLDKIGRASSFLLSSLLLLVATYLSPAIPLFVSHKKWQSALNVTGFVHGFLSNPSHPHHWSDFILEVYLDSPFLSLRWPKARFGELHLPVTCSQVGCLKVWVSVTGIQGEDDKHAIAVMDRPNCESWVWRPSVPELRQLCLEQTFWGWDFTFLFFSRVLNPPWVCPSPLCQTVNKGEIWWCEMCLTQQGQGLNESPFWLEFQQKIQKPKSNKSKRGIAGVPKVLRPTK